MEDKKHLDIDVITALITPFNGDKIDYLMLDKLIEYQISHNVGGILVGGTTGEGSTLSLSEKLNLIKRSVEIAKKRTKIIANVGTNDTKTSVMLATEAEKLGADVLLVISPYYNKCTDGGLISHFKMISDAVSIPIIMYNIPQRTGFMIKSEVAKKIYDECENVVAIKEASGNISNIIKLRTTSNIEVYSGCDDLNLPIVALGGCGTISVLSNVIPSEVSQIIRLAKEEKIKKAQEITNKYMDLTNLLFCEVNPIPVKMALELILKTDFSLRMPLTRLTKVNTILLKEELRKLGIIDE